MHLAALLPVKAFGEAKRRLAGTLSPRQRRELAVWMAERVLAAAAPAPVFVVCDDDEVASWAESRGATVLWRPGHGLNPAVNDGVRSLGDKGFDHVLVSHSDLPLATDLTRLAIADHITLVPDLRDDGTNVIALPTGTDFEFAYGGGSFDRHTARARLAGLEVRIIRDTHLARDVDTPIDLTDPLIQGVLSWLPTNQDSRH